MNAEKLRSKPLNCESLLAAAHPSAALPVSSQRSRPAATFPFIGDAIVSSLVLSFGSSSAVLPSSMLATLVRPLLPHPNASGGRGIQILSSLVFHWESRSGLQYLIPQLAVSFAFPMAVVHIRQVAPKDTLPDLASRQSFQNTRRMATPRDPSMSSYFSEASATAL